MGKVYPDIGPRMRAFIERQPLFFVATAPLATDGHINISPKGRSGTLAVLDSTTLAYLDFGGSHAETIAHLRDNGRITLMWCAFSGPPTIVRVHGRGEPIFRDDPRFPGLLARFTASDADDRSRHDEPVDTTHCRAVVVVRAERVSDSCGYAVPLLDYQGDRDLHQKYFGRKDDDGFAAYCETKEFNGSSIDGLPALPLPLPPPPVATS